jgi:hypothetical protein
MWEEGRNDVAMRFGKLNLIVPFEPVLGGSTATAKRMNEH